MGVVAGVAEHQALVAGADVLARGGVVVHAHGDVGRLFVDGDQHRAVVGADAHVGVGVADVADHFADDLLHVDRGLGRDLAGDDAQAGGDHRLAGDAAHRVLGEQGVEHAVGDLVGQLVGMAHADGFAGEQISCRMPRMDSPEWSSGRSCTRKACAIDCTTSRA